MIESSDPRSSHFREMRHQDMRPEHLFGRRMEMLTLAVLVAAARAGELAPHRARVDVRRRAGHRARARGGRVLRRPGVRRGRLTAAGAIGIIRPMDLGRARKILNVAHSAFISMDDLGRVTYWNIRAEETFGWTREQAVGRDVIELIVPERYREALRDGFRRVQSGWRDAARRAAHRADRAARRRQRVPGRSDRLGARGGRRALVPRLHHRHLRARGARGASASGCSTSSSARSPVPSSACRRSSTRSPRRSRSAPPTTAWSTPTAPRSSGSGWTRSRSSPPPIRAR